MLRRDLRAHFPPALVLGVLRDDRVELPELLRDACRQFLEHARTSPWSVSRRLGHLARERREPVVQRLRRKDHGDAAGQTRQRALDRRQLLLCAASVPPVACAARLAQPPDGFGDLDSSDRGSESADRTARADPRRWRSIRGSRLISNACSIVPRRRPTTARRSARAAPSGGCAAPVLGARGSRPAAESREAPG